MIKRETSTSVGDLHSVSERIKRLAISIDGKPALQDPITNTADMSAFISSSSVPVVSVLSQAKYNFSDRYEMMNEIGRGGFSIVYKCRDRVTNEIYAVKVVDLRPLRLREKFNPARIRREVDIIKRLRHPNIVHFIDVYETEDQLMMVMEYCPGVELFDVILAKKFIPEEVAKSIFAQVARALYYLHTLNIIHRDIKPENVLILNRPDASGLPIAKLLDFGLSKNAGNGSAAKTFVGTPCYLAPEVELTSRGLGGTYGLPADCWSAGAVLYVMLVARFPEFEADPLGKVVLRLSPALWDGISGEAKDLIRSLMNTNPAARMTMAGALQHPWLGQYRATQDELLSIAQQSYEFGQGLQEEEEAFFREKELQTGKVDDVELSSSGVAHHKTAMVIRTKSPGRIGIDSDFPVAPLLRLQRSIATCFEEAHACYEHEPEIASMVRKGANLCRHQVTESTKMLRHVEQTASAVLNIFPDLELAVEEGEPRLASEFFNVVRTWVSQLRETVASTQAANKASMDQIQTIIEDSTRDLHNRNRVNRPVTVPNRLIELLKMQLANTSIANSAHNENGAEGAESGGITLSPEDLMELFYSLFDTNQQQQLPNLLNRRAAPTSDQVEVLSSPGQSFQSEGNIRAAVGKSREDSVDIDETIRICEDHIDNYEGLPDRRSVMDFDRGSIQQLNSGDSDISAMASEDPQQCVRNPFNDPKPMNQQFEQHDSIMSALSSGKSSQPPVPLPTALRPGTLSPSIDKMSSTSTSSTVDISLHPGEGNLVAAISSPVAASKLGEALLKLRQVDQILEQLSVFWANTEVVLDVLTKKGQHVEQFIGFASKPKLLARFKERLEEYKRFWEGVSIMCNNYIAGVQQPPSPTSELSAGSSLAPMSSKTTVPVGASSPRSNPEPTGMYSFLDSSAMDVDRGVKVVPIRPVGIKPK